MSDQKQHVDEEIEYRDKSLQVLVEPSLRKRVERRRQRLIRETRRPVSISALLYPIIAREFASEEETPEAAAV